MYSRNFKTANLIKDWARKTHIRKLPHLRNVRKVKKFCKSANFRICFLRNLFADRPPLPETITFLFCELPVVSSRAPFLK